ncbi:MAG TPA: type I restriction enzyme HsdR N-terminal domain-containing protein [Lunatimonas sp.]|nr:type I restriction enzyme HsdR N-terminal domain-containing protein [Lunatimonas sp.]
MNPISEAKLKQCLNLPQAPLTTTFENGQWLVLDVLRKKKLVLTPEEWVRQHLVHYLIEYKHYSKSLFVLEKGLKYNQLIKRLDVLVMDRMGNPYLLIECKAPEVRLSERTIEQVCLYNHTVKARYIAISNGIRHVCMSYSVEEKRFIPMTEFPDFDK